MKNFFLSAAFVATSFVAAPSIAKAAVSASTSTSHQNTVTIAVFSINDFHAGLLPDRSQGTPGAAYVVQTLDSLKKVYPYNVTVSAGDNFGGSFFYNATRTHSLMPQMFKDMGVNISVLGNHEYDEGQESLARKWNDVDCKPKSWDITYIGANVRNAAGQLPKYVQPWAVVPVKISPTKTLNVSFIGLLTSNTPWQAAAKRLKGLSFDGNYPAVLDSISHLPGYEAVHNANVRLLLCHIGAEMHGQQVLWSDRDEENLKKIDSPDVQAVLSGHSHTRVIGMSDSQKSVPIVQGLWHGRCVSMLKCEVDTLSGQLVSITPELVRVNPDAKLEPKAARLQAQVEEQYHTTLFRGIPLSQKLTYASAAVEHDRTRSKRQTKVGSLVCQSFAAAYRKAAHLDDNALVVGVSHFGSIRAGFPQGDITILSVGEALPFANPLRVYRYTGKQLLDLVEHGYNVCKLGHLQTSGVNPILDAKGHVKALSLTLPNGKTVPIRANTKLVIVADEFMTTGGDGYLPSQFPASAEIKVNIPTSTDAFIAYLRTLPNID